MNGRILRSAIVNCPLAAGTGDSVQIATADSSGVRVLFVRPGLESGDGSRQRPFNCLQLAIDSAHSGDVIVVADPRHQSGDAVRWPVGKQLRVYAGFSTDFARRLPLHLGPPSVPSMHRLPPPQAI